MEKQIGKKILSVILAVIMMLTVMPAGSIVADAASKIAILTWPVYDKKGNAKKSISGHFNQKYTFNGTTYYHKGTDIGNATNSDWYCAYSGTIDIVYDGCKTNMHHSHSGCKPTKNGKSNKGEMWNGTCNNGTGNGFVIKAKIGKDTYYFHYAHMNSINKDLKAGNKINAGTYLGTVGDRGNSSGTHAHFNVTKNKEWNMDSSVDSDPSHSGCVFNYNYSLSYKFNHVNDVVAQRTNSSLTITGDLSASANIESWGYYQSENKNDLTNAKSLKGRKVTMNAKTSTANKLTAVISGLKPNTRYWHLLWAKINGKMVYSIPFYGDTLNQAPSAPSIKSVSGDIGISDSPQISWNAASGAQSYIVSLYNNSNQLVFTQNNVAGTTYSIPNTYFSKAGDYYVSVSAKNAVSAVASAKEKITVHPDVTVTFVDSQYKGDSVVDGDTLQSQSVHYNHNADAPASPKKEGYTFKKWSVSFNNVKENITVRAEYEPIVYTVKFADGYTGKILSTQKVAYGKSAEAPSVTAPNGYTFVGWDVDYTKIVEDTTVTANFNWYNNDYPLSTSVKSVTRNSDKNGYDVVLSIQNGKDEIVKGRNVIVLRSKSGAMLAKSESAPFSISDNDTKEVKLFILSDSLAYNVEVYTFNAYESAGTIAEPVTAKVDNSSNWSGWIEYSGEVPVQKGVDGVSDVETTTKTQYRQRTKSTTTSYATSLDGWTQNGGSWVSKGQSKLNYVSSWPGGFNQNNNLYKAYNNKPKSNSENATTKIVVNSNNVKGYIYWHWCYGKKYSTPQNHFVGWTPKDSDGPFNTFHAFERSTTLPWKGKTYNCFELSDKNKCADTKWWLGAKSGTGDNIVVRTQTYTTYSKLYNYYKWSAWGDWTDSNIDKTSSNEVESRTLNYYRYKTTDEIADAQVDSSQIVDISGKVDSKFAGKEATVIVHKYTEPSDYTNEYLGKTTVASDGTISLSQIKLRESATTETGDFTIAASIAGSTQSIEIGKIYAPKAKYTVKYYDFDGSVLFETTVSAGDTVTAPKGNRTHPDVGYRFSNWNQSSANVNANLNIYPEKEKEQYSVVFVDWTNQTVTLDKYEYGSVLSLTAPESTQAGTTVSWNMDGISKNDSGDYIVTKDLVITTSTTKNDYTINFVSPKDVEPSDPESEDPTIDSSQAEELDKILVDNEKYGENAEVPEIDELDEAYVFYGWRNVGTGEYLSDTTVTNNATYYPVYQFAQTADMPTADVATGEYSSEQTVALTTQTDKAVIYYTTDGSDPKTSKTAKEYTAPITLKKSCVLKYYATAMSMNSSTVGSEIYAINTATSGEKYCLVTVVSSLDYTENYYALVKSGTKADLKEIKNVTGSDYVGVYTSSDYSTKFDEENQSVTSSMTLYAKYTPKKCKVTFYDYQNLNSLGSVTVDYGTEAEFTAPKRDGYVFVGWSEDVSCVTNLDMSVYAVYVAEDEYATVSLNTDSITVKVGSSNASLKTSVTPAYLTDYEIIWTVENDEIATVDENGVVTGVSQGETTVTATVSTTGEKAECKVNVEGDTDNSLIINKKADIKYDSQGYIREIKENSNTVSAIKDKFNNNDDEIVIRDKNSNILSNDAIVGTGCVIELVKDSKAVDKRTFVMTGDVNGDGHIGNADVSMINQWLTNSIELSYEQQLACDVNGDGNVDNKDSTVISRFLVGKATL